MNSLPIFSYLFFSEVVSVDDNLSPSITFFFLSDSFIPMTFSTSSVETLTSSTSSVVSESSS
jgi:hypothetical protein